MGSLGVGLSLVIFLVGVVLLICWIILPFALIGTKPLLRKLVQEQQYTNALLQALRDQGHSGTATSNGSQPAEPPSGARRKGWE